MADRRSVWKMEVFTGESREASSALTHGDALGAFCDLGHLVLVYPL